MGALRADGFGYQLCADQGVEHQTAHADPADRLQPGKYAQQGQHDLRGHGLAERDQDNDGHAEGRSTDCAKRFGGPGTGTAGPSLGAITRVANKPS